tara:strand:+ start:386 stop:502 length:117 start_codon:yes stop_codon:yes gene_type:complete
MSFARLLFLRLCDFATWKMKKNNEKKGGFRLLGLDDIR